MDRPENVDQRIGISKVLRIGLCGRTWRRQIMTNQTALTVLAHKGKVAIAFVVNAMACKV